MAARDTREQHTREALDRKTKWVNPNHLLDPEPRPGFAHRWVRVSSFGWGDTRNVSSKFLEGWEPCHPDEYPEFKHLVNRDTGQIELGGLVLCRAPEQIVEQRREYYARMAQNQIEAIDQHMMRERDPRMPWLKPERVTTEEFGDGTPPVRAGRL